MSTAKLTPRMNNRPSVLFVDQSGELGGAELSLLDIVRARKAAGYDRDKVVLFADGPLSKRLNALSVEVEVISFNRKVGKQAGIAIQLLAIPAAYQVIRRIAAAARDHDAVYANTQKAIVLGGMAARLAKRPLVAHLHDVLEAAHFSRSNRRVSVLCMNACATAVIANSHATADAYQRSGGMRTTHIAHNGIDAAPFDAVSSDHAYTVRQSLAIPDAAPLVGVFGRITEWKGHRVLLEAIQCEGLGHVQVAVVGDALFTDADRRLVEELRAISAQDSLAGRVHWLGHRDDVPTVMKACDVIVHCSTQPEPFGRVIVEGQLAGRPVIAAAGGGAVEIIEDGVNGLLTPPGDASSLAEAMRCLLADSELARSLADSGARTARTRFTLDAYVAAVNQIVNAVVTRG